MVSYLPGYPKQMHHPAHKPSVLRQEVTGFTDHSHGPTIHGTAMMFPPQTAETPDAEADLRARGYLESGESATVTAYQEYPLMMTHPDHVDAVPDRIEAQASPGGGIQTLTVKGSPERFPHQVVTNGQEESAWAAKGYRRPGKADDEAFDRATEAPGMPGAEWPKWIDGVLMQDPDTPVPQPDLYPMWVTGPGKDAPEIVKNAAEYAKVMGKPYEGELPPKSAEAATPSSKPAFSAEEWTEYQALKAWKASQAADAIETATEAGDGIDGLRKTADELGLEYDKRWGRHRMLQLIEQKRAA